MSELIDISGKKISSVQTTYADLFSIYSSLGNMTPALAYFTRKVREKFMKLNGERIKSINQKYVELQMKYFNWWRKHTEDDEPTDSDLDQWMDNEKTRY